MKEEDHLKLFSRLSVTRFGDFFKIIGNNISFKRSQNICWLPELFWKPNILNKKRMLCSFGQVLDNFWATLYFNIWSHWPNPIWDDNKDDNEGLQN